MIGVDKSEVKTSALSQGCCLPLWPPQSAQVLVGELHQWNFSSEAKDHLTILQVFQGQEARIRYLSCLSLQQRVSKITSLLDGTKHNWVQ